ncbi:MAG: hypothetical protein E7774_12630 [Bradyrhizobium sp.]|nr:MAG: hypothetical protein E7774_12630 [Bradyrhizobium sp.]
MRKFTCPTCDTRLYFENFVCETCSSSLAFDPRTQGFERLDGEESVLACGNRNLNVCNWRKANAEDAFCQSCRLDRTIPRLNDEANVELWRRLEFAKRRVLYDLGRLGLTTPARGDGLELGLAFDFLAAADGNVVTGHDGGLITINLAEADDARREQIRTDLHEPYRTLVGHFRHECGHYLWQRFVVSGEELERFRAVFGDERRDYAQALRDHYARPPEWRTQFVSDYAASHPWEDWAECAAHYLHIVSTLDTFISSPLGAPERAKPVDDPYRESDFDAVLSQWFPLAESLNELNRSMGLHDPYPFVLTPATIEKLRLVQQILRRAAASDATMAHADAVG